MIPRPSIVSGKFNNPEILKEQKIIERRMNEIRRESQDWSQDELSKDTSKDKETPKKKWFWAANLGVLKFEYKTKFSLQNYNFFIQSLLLDLFYSFSSTNELFSSVHHWYSLQTYFTPFKNEISAVFFILRIFFLLFFGQRKKSRVAAFPNMKLF